MWLAPWKAFMLTVRPSLHAQAPEQLLAKLAMNVGDHGFMNGCRLIVWLTLALNLIPIIAGVFVVWAPEHIL